MPFISTVQTQRNVLPSWSPSFPPSPALRVLPSFPCAEVPDVGTLPTLDMRGRYLLTYRTLRSPTALPTVPQKSSSSHLTPYSLNHTGEIRMISRHLSMIHPVPIINQPSPPLSVLQLQLQLHDFSFPPGEGLYTISPSPMPFLQPNQVASVHATRHDLQQSLVAVISIKSCMVRPAFIQARVPPSSAPLPFIPWSQLH